MYCTFLKRIIKIHQAIEYKVFRKNPKNDCGHVCIKKACNATLSFGQM